MLEDRFMLVFGAECRVEAADTRGRYKLCVFTSV